MEELLDQADALVQLSVTQGEPPLPNLPIPKALTALVNLDQIELKDDPWKGRGWFAATDIKAGQLIRIAKPIAKVMDWQEYDEGEEDDDPEEEDGDDVEPLMNELLLIETLQTIVKNPNVWHTQLSTLFPRNDSDLSTLPAWVCHNDDVFIQVESLLAQLEQVNQTTTTTTTTTTQIEPPLLLLPVKDISTRLPLIVRYNVLSMETCAELLSYPSPNMGHTSLAGIGLYHEPSFFNHSKEPNVNRWCVGDVMGFVSNQAIQAGSELCISYIEHDVLCEPSNRRNMMLSMDFFDTDDGDDNGTSVDTEHLSTGGDGRESAGESATTNASKQQPQTLSRGPEAPVVDSDVQNELMAMAPLERLNAIEELLLQAKGLKLPTDANGDSAENQLPSRDNGSYNFQGSESTMDMTESLPSENNDNIINNNGVDNNNSLETPITTPWFQCDVHNLRLLKAITYDGLNRSQEAYQEWNESIRFVQTQLPPHDESLVVLHVQAALCAYHCHCKEDQPTSDNHHVGHMLLVAKEHAAQATITHDILFGGGNQLLRRRYKNELQLTLRPAVSSECATNPADILWPLLT